jgi:septal ring factor EnvC (AmiA/AmiB activator)
MKISAIYRKIFSAVEFEDFEDWAVKTTRALFSLTVGVILVVMILAMSLHEQRAKLTKMKSDVENINIRIEASEKRLDAINKRLDALEQRPEKKR